MKKTILITAMLSIALFSCEPMQNDDVVQSPNREGSIETILAVTHEKGFDLLKTTHNIWVSNKLSKTITTTDTLKFLGTTIQEGENSEGEVKNLVVPKDYELYITVK